MPIITQMRDSWSAKHVRKHGYQLARHFARIRTIPFFRFGTMAKELRLIRSLEFSLLTIADISAKLRLPRTGPY